MSKKVTLLKSPYSVKQDVPYHVREISIANQEVPGAFSTTPPYYGNVAISREELAALSLSSKFTV